MYQMNSWTRAKGYLSRLLKASVGFYVSFDTKRDELAEQLPSLQVAS